MGNFYLSENQLAVMRKGSYEEQREAMINAIVLHEEGSQNFKPIFTFKNHMLVVGEAKVLYRYTFEGKDGAYAVSKKEVCEDFEPLSSEQAAETTAQATADACKRLFNLESKELDKNLVRRVVEGMASVKQILGTSDQNLVEYVNKVSKSQSINS